MITKDLKKYGDFSGWYLFKKDNLICPACGGNISEEVKDFINDQEKYGDAPEYSSLGPVCPKCEAMVNINVKNKIYVVKVGKDVNEKNENGQYKIPLHEFKEYQYRRSSKYVNGLLTEGRPQGGIEYIIMLKDKSPYKLTMDDLYKVFKVKVSSRTCWYMHPTTLLFLETLTDTYCYENYEYRLFGYLIVQDPSMPSIDSVAPGEAFIKFIDPDKISCKIKTSKEEEMPIQSPENYDMEGIILNTKRHFDKTTIRYKSFSRRLPNDFKIMLELIFKMVPNKRYRSTDISSFVSDFKMSFTSIYEVINLAIDIGIIVHDWEPEFGYYLSFKSKELHTKLLENQRDDVIAEIKQSLNIKKESP